MDNDNQDGITFTTEVIEQIKNGRKIQAIKLLREENNMGLKEAKEAVEAYMEHHVEIKNAFNANNSREGLSQERVLQITILVIVLLIVYMVV